MARLNWHDEDDCYYFRYLHIFVRFSEGLKAVGEPRNIATQFSPFHPKQFFVKLDQFKVALGGCIVISVFLLQEPTRHLENDGIEI